ncbi:hypothetical protein QTP86_011814 [Hemibagrus guttatus]|nr:hypothetical protein QTP86_011814 [Hemibagrus guttatus]
MPHLKSIFYPFSIPAYPTTGSQEPRDYPRRLKAQGRLADHGVTGLRQRRKCLDPYAEPAVGKTQYRKSGTGNKSATGAVRPKLPQERNDNSSRRSEKTPQQHQKNCRPHLPQLRDTAREAFTRLKHSFTTAPILQHPDLEVPFIVEVDALSCGISAVLSQHHGNPGKLHPCAFYSRKLIVAEINYDVGDRELLFMKVALEEWPHQLEGARHPLLVLMDHRNLEYLRGAKRLNPHQARWALLRQQEAKNLIVHPEPIIPPSVILAPIQWNLVEEIQRAHAEDPPLASCPPFKLYVPANLPNSGGFTTILVIINCFSKACKLIPLKGLPTAMGTATALYYHVFRNFGLPEDIVSEQGTQFTSQDSASLPSAEDVPSQTFFFLLVFAGTRSTSLLIGGGDHWPHLPPSLPLGVFGPAGLRSSLGSTTRMIDVGISFVDFFVLVLPGQPAQISTLQVFLHLLPALTTDHNVICKHHCPRTFLSGNWSITIANRKGLRADP